MVATHFFIPKKKKPISVHGTMIGVLLRGVTLRQPSAERW
jgi:hypothetical protein